MPSTTPPPADLLYDRLARNARRGWLVALGAAALLIVLALLSARRYVDALAWVEHTGQVDDRLARTHADLLEVGCGARGYIISGDELFLAPLVRARGALAGDLAELRRLTADNPRQQARLDELERFAAERLRIADENVALRRAGDERGAFERVRAGEGQRAADAAWAVLEAMRAEETTLLAERRAATSRALIATGALTAGALAIFLLTAAVGGVRLPRLVREVARAQRNLHVNRELYRTLVKNLPDAVAFLFDHDLRLVLVEGERLLAGAGLERERLQGTYALDAVSAANRPLLERAYRGALGGEEASFELTFGGRHFLITVAPVRDDGGAIVAGLALGRDVTERKHTEEALADERATLRAVLDAMPDAVVVADVAGRVTLMNAAARAALGEPGPDGAPAPYARAARPAPPDAPGGEGSPLSRVLRGESAEGASADEASPLSRALRGESVHGVELGLPGPGGRHDTWHSLNVTPVRDEGGAVRGAVCVGRDVTEQRRAREALRQLSTRDELTGLYNRRGFLALAQERARLAARSGRPFALAFIDLNGMKQINDRLGHEEGDRALVDAAELLRKTLRETDLAARLGGDEFVALLADADATRAGHLVERLYANLARQNETSGRKFRLSVSTGVAVFDPSSPETLEQLLGRADARMYEFKRSRSQSLPAVAPPSGDEAPRDAPRYAPPSEAGRRTERPNPPAGLARA
jgi:diguanylate cyclase (GGDEF)-like protein/PAS domain S-box-containing protein